MRSSTETIIKALRILAVDIQSGDGVANAAIAEAADRLKELSQDNVKPNPEPVAWIDKVNFELLSKKNWSVTCHIGSKPTGMKNIPLYADPPRQTKPLTDEFIKICYSKSLEDSYYEDVDWGITPTKKLNIIKFARAIENAHGITS